MYFFVGMQVHQTLQNWLKDAGDFALVELFLSDVNEIDNAARVTILEYNP